MEDEKNKIITQYYQDDEMVDLVIDDWLIMDQWRETSATEEMISTAEIIKKLWILNLN